MTALVDCPACRAGLSLVWSVQAKKTMHEAQGLSLTPCKRLEAHVPPRNAGR